MEVYRKCFGDTPFCNELSICINCPFIYQCEKELQYYCPGRTFPITTANLVSSSLGAGTYGMSFGVSSSLSFTVVCVLLVVAVLFIVKYVTLYVLRVLANATQQWKFIESVLVIRHFVMNYQLV
jgi:hypothetical protein